MIGLPTPLDDIKSVGFVTGNAIPTLEYLLTGVVVPCRSDRRIVDPLPIGVIAESSIRRYLIVCFGGFGGIELEVSMVLRRKRGLGGGFEERENEEERGEAEEREEEEGGVGRGRGRGGGCVLL